MQVTDKRYYSPEEYIALEEAADYKSEYIDGEIIPMAGGSTNHNQIAGNFYAESFCEYDESDDAIALSSLSFEVSLADIYNKVNLEQVDAVSAPEIGKV
ncbi:MAG: hypothetical protein F6K28_22610 [Microcoleus sp. SIO2G3]|nr:hypothetical protein [Microcoleus sp. SIO2G3]